MVISQFVICYQVYQRVNTPMLHRQYLEITELIWEDGIAKNETRVTWVSYCSYEIEGPMLPCKNQMGLSIIYRVPEL